MKILTAEILHFLKSQNFVIVSTVDKNGRVHNSCKGIVKVTVGGKIYLLDLYRAGAYQNLKSNPNISIASVDEHKFKGYCLKGKAEIIDGNRLGQDILKAWENRITSRITQRVLKNIRGEKGHSLHPEVQLPKPEYMIVMDVDSVVNLTPHKLK